MPSVKVRDDYKLTELYDLGQAAIKGDVKMFESILMQNQMSLIRIGIYLVLVHVKAIVYRNLFKRIMILINRTTPNPYRVNLQVCESVLKSLDEDVDMD